MNNTILTPTDLAEFCHEVPKRATIPAHTPFVTIDRYGNLRVLLDGLSEDRLPEERNDAYWTMEPIPDPGPVLPTETGSLVIAHTEDDPTRRVFMRDEAGPWHDGERFWAASDIIDPVPAKAVEVES